MAPVVKACLAHANIDPLICVTGQHREMLQQVTDYFGIVPDIDLKLMRENQTLAGLTSRCIESMDEVLTTHQPDCAIAQGDTTTVMATALASFYRHVPFVHVEAGLRTGNLQAPWPEELNRRVAGIVTSLHCAPTQRSADNLLSEGVPERTVHVTGNTVIDALLWAVGRERERDADWEKQHPYMAGNRSVLITGHRRENFGGGFQDICRAIETLAKRFSDVQFVYPVHLNPNVQKPVHELLGGLSNVHLIAPAPYPEFVWLMDRCTLILTDSGGVQEEAPSVKKPVLVMRETTERPEAMDAGAVELVGTDVTKIIDRVSGLLEDPADYASHIIETNPYGDGKAAARIVKLICEQGWEKST
jgi:UDP-N-acetylglucosamine 2-epimerase (non-hydrolysing)